MENGNRAQVDFDLTGYKKNKRVKEAKKVFEQADFSENCSIQSIFDLLTMSSFRYDATIDWYQRHVWWRHKISVIIRLFSVILITIGSILIAIKAFYIGDLGISFTIPYININFQYTVTSVVLFIFGSGLLFADSMFQITNRYGLWWVLIYTIRIMRTEFEVQFHKEFGVFNGQTPDEVTFQKAKNFCREQFKLVEVVVKEETESWQQTMVVAMTKLREKLEKEGAVSRQTAADVVKMEHKVLASEKSEAEKREPRPVNIEIVGLKNADKDNVLVVKDKRNREVSRTNNISQGQIIPLILPPGLYIVSILDTNEISVVAKWVEVETGKSLELKLKA